MAFCRIGSASMRAARCVASPLKSVPFLALLTSLPRGGLSKDQWQLPVWLIAHRACLPEHGASPHERIRRPALSAPCRPAYPALRVLLFVFQAFTTPPSSPLL